MRYFHSTRVGARCDLESLLYPLFRHQISRDCIDVDVRGGVAFEDDDGSFEAVGEGVGGEVGVGVGDVAEFHCGDGVLQGDELVDEFEAKVAASCPGADSCSSWNSSMEVSILKELRVQLIRYAGMSSVLG